MVRQSASPTEPGRETRDSGQCQNPLGLTAAEEGAPSERSCLQRFPLLGCQNPLGLTARLPQSKNGETAKGDGVEPVSVDVGILPLSQIMRTWTDGNRWTPAHGARRLIPD